MTGARLGGSRRQKTVITVISKIAERQSLPNACLVVIYGQELGRRYVLDRPEVTVGRSAQCEIVLDQESVSRQHARILVNANRTHVKDLGSTNGSYVNDELVADHILKDGDFVKIGRTIFKYLTGDNIEGSYHEEIYRLTTVDGLTQTYNRRYLQEQLGRELSRSTRYGRPLSMAVMDVDEFQKLNHEFGHLAGDSVLSQLAGLMRKNIRREDILARTDGDEFSFILPETPLVQARNFAEKVRTMVEAHAFSFEGTPIKCTVSLGLAASSGQPPVPALEQFLKVGQDNLDVAKRLGRNRVAG